MTATACRLLLPGLLAFGVLLALPAGAFAQGEAGTSIEFPFRRADGTLVWFAEAQRGQRRYGLRHPMDGTPANPWVFERDPLDPRPESADQPGVKVVIPIREGGAGSPRALVLEAERAEFWAASELLGFHDVRLEMRFGDAPEADGSDPAGGPSRDPRGLLAELTTPLLWIEWHTAPDGSPRAGERVAHVFTDQRFQMTAPGRGIHIRQAAGFDADEADGFRTIRVHRDFDGSFRNAAWLAIDRSGSSSVVGETRFACEGECVISFGETASRYVERIELDRGVVVAQVPGGRELRCNHLAIRLEPPSQMDDPPRVEWMRADDRVDLYVPGSFHARVGVLETTFDELPDGGRTQRAEMERVVRLQLFADDFAGPALTGLPDIRPDGDDAIGPGTRVRTRIDGLARDRIIWTSSRPALVSEDGNAGSETWEFLGNARLERYVREITGRDRPGPGTAPDFGVPIGPDVVAEGWPGLEGWGREQTPAGARARAEERDADYHLSAVINGSGGVRDPGAGEPAPRTGDNGDADTTSLDGSIVLQFRLVQRDVASPAIGGSPTVREAVRELDALTVINPGNVPVLELNETGPGFGVRFLAGRLDVSRERLPDGSMRQQAVFGGENPQVTWLTSRNLDPLAAVAPLVQPRADGRARPGPEYVPDDAVFRYLINAQRPFTLRQTPDPATGRLASRELLFDGPVALRKTLWSRAGQRDLDARRLRLAVNCRDLAVTFDNRFGEGLELTRLEAEPLPAGDSDAAPRMTFEVGYDSGWCAGLRILRRPASGEPRPIRNAANEWVPAPWTETVHVAGPLRIELRDPVTAGMAELTGPQGDTVLPAFVRATVEGRVTVRSVVARMPGGLQSTRRRDVELVGPFAVHMLADDPAEVPADRTPRGLASAAADYLRAVLVADVDPTATSAAGTDAGAGSAGQPFERVARVWMAGGVEWTYKLHGIAGSAQRLDYHHDPADDVQPLPRLLLTGSPHIEVAVTMGQSRGTGEIVFPVSDNPAEAAARCVELIGAPDIIRIRPRCGLRWTPVDDAPVLLLADRIDIGLTRRRPGEPASAPEDTIARSRRGMLAGSGGQMRFEWLEGLGNVIIRQGEREAHGATLRWREDVHGGRTAELEGRSPTFRDNTLGRISFELANVASGAPASGGGGATYRYREHDPDHPERRHMVTAEGRERMRLQLRLPRD